MEIKKIAEMESIWKERQTRAALLVCGASFRSRGLYAELRETAEKAGTRLTEFSDFAPNPRYESVVKGVRLFAEEQCDFIIAAGGGSAMDVAKCIKLFWNLDPDRNYLEQEIVENEVPLLAIPTTAGTGSEATRFAIIYYEGNKQSVAHAGCIPDYVLLDASLLDTLPEYQRKATMLDALCHALESYWCVSSTKESREYAAEAIREVFRYQRAYLANERAGNEGMLRAANTAGRAINLTQTTAGHAMCYKLTTLYGLAHGHAAALCVAALWPYMIAHIEDCTDPRGASWLRKMFQEIAEAMGCKDAEDAVRTYGEFLEGLKLPVPVLREERELELLTRSVNPDRLKNHPVLLTGETLEMLYRRILKAD
ncbi:MAG: phosphonoacetaldehyde reductase [Lachnospiraceae bacterium]